MANRFIGLMLLAACASSDDKRSDDTGADAGLERAEREQLDCRPVCVRECGHPWNVRACCSVPPECAVELAPVLAPESP